MKIKWLGHACFKIEQNGYTVIFDPYKDGSVPGLCNVRENADLVICSHEHGDHSGRECVQLTEGKENPFVMTQLSTYHDDAKGSKRGQNIITILNDGKVKVAHLGDLGCDLTEEEEEALQNLDVMMIPVGGFFTIDGKQAAEIVHRVNPKYVIPMHFSDVEKGFGYDVISKVNVFTDSMESVCALEYNEIDTEEKKEAQVLVLTPSNLV